MITSYVTTRVLIIPLKAKRVAFSQRTAHTLPPGRATSPDLLGPSTDASTTDHSSARLMEKVIARSSWTEYV